MRIAWVTAAPLSSDPGKKKKGAAKGRVLRSASLRTNELCRSATLAGGSSSRVTLRCAARGPDPLEGAVREPATLGGDDIQLHH